MCTAGPEPMYPSFWKLYLDDFPFFWFLSSSSRNRARAVWSLGDNGATNHHHHHHQCHQLQTALARVLDELKGGFIAFFCFVFSCAKNCAFLCTANFCDFFSNYLRRIKYFFLNCKNFRKYLRRNLCLVC